VRKIIIAVTCLIGSVACVGYATAANSEDIIRKDFGNVTSARIEGIAVTGSNDVCGERLWSYPAPFDDAPLGFSMLAEYNPGARLPIPFTRDNCQTDTPIASHFDPILAAIGLPEPNDGLLNVPISDMFRISDFAGLRTQLPRMGEVPPNPFPQTLGALADDLTLQDWLSADGNMNILCKRGGTTQIRASYRNLIPNGMYSVWGIWITTPPGALAPTLAAIPLGGVPNAMVASERGRARFSRQMNFCPFDIAPDGSTLLYIATAYHSDNAMYGGVPETVATEVNILDEGGAQFVTPLSLVVHQEQVVFRINAENLPEADPVQFRRPRRRY